MRITAASYCERGAIPTATRTLHHRPGIATWDIAYWKEQLRDAPVLELPTSRTRPPVQSHRGASVTFEIESALVASIERASRAEGATLFMALLGVYQLLLARLSGQDDIVTGIPEAGRRHRDIEGLIGCFANTLAVRTAFDDELTAAGLLGRVRQAVLGAMDHAEVPFHRVVSELGVQRDPSRSPVFQAMFSLQTAAEARADLIGLRVTRVHIDRRAAMFDLTLWVSQTDTGLRCTLEYATDLFDRDFIEQCAHGYVMLLEQAARAPHAPVMTLPMLSAASRARLLSDRTGAGDATLAAGSFLEWVEANVRTAPERCAIEDESGHRWSYAELWSYAGRVANALAARGVGTGDLAGVRLGRGAPMLGVALGILRCGAAYLPLDPGFPAERLAYMVEDGGVRLVITDDPAPLGSVELASPESLLDAPTHADVALPEPAADDMAYVLYTSGSTGRAKGVEITHGALRNLLGSMRQQPGLCADDVLLAITTLSFDISGLELFLPLCVGARVFIASTETAGDGSALADRLTSSGATVMQATPATWRMLVDAGWRGRLCKVLSGGDALSEELARALVQRADEVWNLYGPTETTIWSTIERIDGGSPILVGRPIANTRVYVLDRNGHVLPDGVQGEIWIAGAGVARGYRNRPDLTSERFRDDPFVSGERMYRTGDLGRWRSNGHLEHLGRLDFQVKVHGYRIESGEVESALETFDEVKQAVVTARGAADDRQLVAYVIFEEHRALAAAEIRRRLGEALPQYMVPGIVVPVESLPLTPNGKVDRNALPDPQATLVQREYEPPHGEVEEAIADVWREVLGVTRVSRNDDFFELGGHSLRAIQVVARLKSRGIALPLRQLMGGRSVAQLAATSGVMRERTERIPQIALGSMLVPGVGQERLWILSHLEDMRSAYNQNIVQRLEGELHRDALDATFTHIIERHPILRSRYPSLNGMMTVEIAPPSPFTVPLESGHAGDALFARIRAFVAAPFDLERGPLFRVLLLRAGHNDHILAIGIHHIISDGWSSSVLLNELSALYREQVTGVSAHLESLPVGFFDFAAWQRDRVDRDPDATTRDLAYWSEQLRDAPVLELPTSRPRAALQSHRGTSVAFGIDSSLKASLERASRAEGATLFMALLGIFQLLLARCSGQADIVVGIPEAGRRHRDVEGLIGCFINTLAIRTAFDQNLTVTGLLDRVRRGVLDAMDHAHVQFDRIVTEVATTRDLSRSPVFQAMFSFQTVAELRADLTGLRVTPLDVGRSAAMFDISLWVNEVDDGLRCELEYATDLFDRDFIEQCARSYLVLIEQFVRAPDAPVMTLPLLSADTARLMRSGRAGIVDDRLRTGSFLEWIEAWARTAPERCAIEDEAGDRWSYGDLWSYSGCIAAGLEREGIGRGGLVGVMLVRDAPLAGVLLGVLRSGAAYLPLDPDLPRDRLIYMIEDAGATLVITDRVDLASATVRPMSPDALEDAGARQSSARPDMLPGGNELAYVLYTSGSTGRPKGVEITHGALRNFLGSMRQQPGLNADDVLLAVTTLSFDISGLELYLPLCVGARVFIASTDTAADGNALADRLASSGATVMQATPATWRMLVDAGWSGGLRTALCGGEALHEELAHALVERADAVWNLYGPTETTIWSTIERIDGSGPVLVGRPIANTRVYVLDRFGQFVPDGVNGEIWIAGAGVARGYRNRPDLTSERFHGDPFVTGDRMYRTGDLGRWRSDGRLEHLGRLDFQVKVHGYRIEPGEIECALEAIDEVRHAVVVAAGIAEDRRLVAYVTFEQGGDLLPSEVRRRLSETLPRYMVPGIIVPIESFPLTPNGKVDRKALPDPLASTVAAVRNEYEPPVGEIEETIAAVWRDLLGVERVGRHDNFFELGGHSLLAVRASALIALQCEHVIEPREFVFRTLMQLAPASPVVDHPSGTVTVDVAPTGSGRAAHGWRRLIRKLTP